MRTVCGSEFQTDGAEDRTPSYIVAVLCWYSSQYHRTTGKKQDVCIVGRQLHNVVHECTSYTAADCECVFVRIMCSSALYETGYALQWYLAVGQVICYRPQISLAKIS